MPTTLEKGKSVKQIVPALLLALERLVKDEAIRRCSVVIFIKEKRHLYTRV